MAFTLPTLPSGADSYTPDQFQIWWQQVVTAIEGQFADIDAVLADLADQQAQITANLATLTAVSKRDKLTVSYPLPANVLSSSDNGTNATITIAAHKRVYGDGTALNVGGGSLTGAYDTDYGIYYDDNTLSDTTPTYAKTATLSNALNNFAPGRHFVGTVRTPTAGAPPTVGGSTPPGSGASTEGDRDKYSSY